MDDIKKILEDIGDILGGTAGSVPPLEDEDGPLLSGPVEVMVKDSWTPVTKEIFASWTGLRRIWGIEYHGPVVYKDCKNGSQYTGPRSCSCAVCQSTVEPKFKMN